MSLDAEARRENSRRNGRKSHGPKSEEGKARSRQNALTHGLRAEVIALPHEDPAAIAARAEAWFDYYQPESPAAHHLVNQCVQATLLADRCQRHHTAALARQVRAADSDWLDQQEDAVERLKKLLPDDPGAAVLGLKRSAAGCRWLITRWERLRQQFDDNGAWCNDDCDEAVRLLGHRSSADELRHSPEGFLVRLYNALCPTVPDERVLEWLCHPARMPGSLQAQYSIDFLPDPERCPFLLREMIDDQLTSLNAVAAWREAEIEGPDRAEAPQRAGLLNDPEASRLFVRYHAESRTAFHRAFKELTRVYDTNATGEEGGDEETGAITAPDVEPVPVALASFPEGLWNDGTGVPPVQADDRGDGSESGTGVPPVEADDRRDGGPTKDEAREPGSYSRNPGVGGLISGQPEDVEPPSPNEPESAGAGAGARSGRPSFLIALALGVLLGFGPLGRASDIPLRPILGEPCSHSRAYALSRGMTAATTHMGRPLTSPGPRPKIGPSRGSPPRGRPCTRSTSA